MQAAAGATTVDPALVQIVCPLDARWHAQVVALERVRAPVGAAWTAAAVAGGRAPVTAAVRLQMGFPPNEAASEESMLLRLTRAREYFLGGFLDGSALLLRR